MMKSPQTTLVLGGTERTGSHMARRLITGNGSTPNDDIEKVTGRPPSTFHDFARRSAHAWISPAAR